MSIRFRYIIVILLSVAGNFAKAQFVEIPDPNFRTWLQAHGFANCFSGTQIDTTCSAVVSATVLEPYEANISDLTGIQYFSNCLVINCSNNQLTFLPPLPPSLSYLHCDHNWELSQWPVFPQTLGELDCSYTDITELPPLPAGLLRLACKGNGLTSLPQLPALLRHLDCQYNNISLLPALPETLDALWVSWNPLTSLPVLPPGLQSLSIVAADINQLPELPATISNISAEYNNLQTLPELPASLIQLWCNNNNITNMPALPAGLQILECNNNLLTQLPEIPSTLDKLNCSYNSLTQLPMLPDSMYMLTIHDNPGLTCLPPVQYLGYPLNLGNTGIACLPNIIQHGSPDSTLDNTPLCGTFGNGCPVAWNISGTIFNDIEENCQLNTEDPKVQNVKLNLYQNGNLLQQVYTSGTGRYSFDTDLANYTVEVDTPSLPFLVNCVTNNAQNVSITSLDSLDLSVSFALTCRPGYDIAVHGIVHEGLFFPAQIATATIFAGDVVQAFGSNCNTNGIAGTLTVEFNGPVSVIAVSGDGSVIGNIVTWQVADLAAIDNYNDFKITFKTDTFPSPGSSVCLVGSISPGGTNAENNSLTQCFDVVNSYDPNIKEAYPKTSAQPGDWHTYTIHFQNTGTAPAIHILVKDTLDQNLDWSSFQKIAASHDNLTQVLENGIVHFNFPNINLADSTSDEPHSHGWIQYRIKTHSALAGQTAIHNTAAIYFDFNAPIITNDAVITYCPFISSEQVFSICDGDSVTVDGVVYSAPGIYSTTHSSVLTCDSLASIIIQSIINSEIILTGETLSAVAGYSYQWINCATGAIITGAVGSSFTPDATGSYAVMLSGQGCSQTSACAEVIVTGINDLKKTSFLLFPNPSSDLLTIVYPDEQNNSSVIITDLAGRIVLNQKLTGPSTQLSIGDVSAGSYMVQLIGETKLMGVKKLVVVK